MCPGSSATDRVSARVLLDYSFSSFLLEEKHFFYQLHSRDIPLPSILITITSSFYLQYLLTKHFLLFFLHPILVPISIQLSSHFPYPPPLLSMYSPVLYITISFPQMWSLLLYFPCIWNQTKPGRKVVNYCPTTSSWPSHMWIQAQDGWN